MLLSRITEDYNFAVTEYGSAVEISFSDGIRMLRPMESSIKDCSFTIELGDNQWREHLALGKPIKITIEPL